MTPADQYRRRSGASMAFECSRISSRNQMSFGPELTLKFDPPTKSTLSMPGIYLNFTRINFAYFGYFWIIFNVIEANLAFCLLPRIF